MVYDVIAEDGKVFDANNAIYIRLVFFFDLGEDGHLSVGLLHDVLALFHNLQGQMLLGLVVEDLDDFAEGPLVDRLDYLIAIGNMIADFVFVKIVLFRLQLFLVSSASHFGNLIIV